ncbi:MAG: hypothetical protein J3Q66DRAFT_347647 [Benniella sp.]|nr:MAG: hypothetical protein J3Q66DRAFT_347647 [Benniella sp.]
MGATTTPTTTPTTAKAPVPKRKKAPSKAPRRLLKKQLRDIERLIQNKNKRSVKDLPEQALQANAEKADRLRKQIEALGPEPTATAEKSVESAKQKSSKAIRFTEMRRAGRKIVAFKKQHPNYENSEEEAKLLSDLELDLLYTKNFPKKEDYIPIYPESTLEDEKRARQKEIRELIATALANGELNSSVKLNTDQEAAKSSPTNEDQPASNWSDDDEEDDEDYNGEEDDEDDSSSESESESEEKPVAKKSKSK